MNAPSNGEKSREYWTLKTLKELMDERHRVIEDRIARETVQQKAEVAAALAAQKEQTRDAFLSSEKAIVKAESAQTAHNLLAAELQDRLDRQATNFIARPEFDSRITGMESKIADLRESRSTDKGTKIAAATLWSFVAFVIGALVTLGGAMLIRR